MGRRGVSTGVRTTLEELSLKSRKEHLTDEINNLLRNRSIDEIDASASLSLLQRVGALLPALTVEGQISLALKEVNIRLDNIERNTAKITITLTSYAAAAKAGAQRGAGVTTTAIIASYNNINQQRQLKEAKREKTLVFKIREQSEKNSLRMLSAKELIERLQRVEKIKENVMTTRRLLSEDVELITRSKETKNRLTISNSLMKNVASSAYAVSRTFEVLTHEVRVTDVQTDNQQEIIRRIEKQNETLHPGLRIARVA
jgi:hypothetical protein